jgi:hypothetical protein
VAGRLQSEYHAPTMIILCAIAAAVPNGAAVLRLPLAGAELAVTTTPRLAGAVHSITWNGVEFIDSLDHGRQLQSAASFDAAKGGRFVPECYNPTEAGSRRDHVGPHSTSRILYQHSTPTELTTRTRAAFWLAPGERSDGEPALNRETLSQHLFTKTLLLNDGGDPHRIRYRITFTLPAGERHNLAQFEAVTGYMPPRFGTFEAFDAKAERLVPLSDGPGEQAMPVVFSTANGSHAMGIIEAERPAVECRGPGYGRFRFAAERVVKWNAVYRITNPAGVPAGDYSFDTIVAVGTRADVRRVLAEVSRVAAARPPPR